ncbi:hypothetical protein EV368DRAFT_87339 [Lentinula lateritia]|nr:hypothetical protein EV368DRAFT_87339 [Lentinula lateritia]
MDTNFSELHLCYDHWKGNYLCTQIYLSWCKNALEKKKDKAVKIERSDNVIMPGEVVKCSASVDANVFAGNTPACSPVPLKKQRMGMECNSALKIPLVNPLLMHRAQLLPSSPSTANSLQGSDQSTSLQSSKNMLMQDFSLDTAKLVESDSNKSTIVQTPITSIPQGSPKITPTGSILEPEAESNTVMDCSEDVGTLKIKECATSMHANDNPSVSSTSTCAAATLAPSDMS